MLVPTWTIARNTFTESVRQPIYVVLLLAFILMLAMNPMLSMFSLQVETDNKLLIDLGLSSLFIGGLLLAAFTATSVLSREIENKTVLTIISKPIARPAFIVGKFLGVTASIGLAFWIWAIVFLMASRHKVMFSAADRVDAPVLIFGFGAFFIALFVTVWGNYFYNWVFSATLTTCLAIAMPLGMLGVLIFNKKWEIQSLGTDLDGQLLIAMLLVLEALLLLCAVAVTCSTRLGQIMTLVVCIGVFLLGLASDSIDQFAQRSIADTWNASQDLANALFGVAGLLFSKFVAAVTPFISAFWISDALTQGHFKQMLDNSPGSIVQYIVTATAYSVLYTVAVLALGAALFQTREVG